MGIDRITGRRRRGRLLTRALLAAFAVAAVTAVAGPASAVPQSKAAATLNVNINGRWTDVGVAKPFIEVNGSSVFIDMSFAGRPNATGSVVGPAKIQVNFPGDNTYVGTVSENEIAWSNGSLWSKVFQGAQIFDVEGVWRNDATNSSVNIGQGGGFVSLDFGPGPDRPGFMTSAATIRVQFGNTDTRNATLVAPNLLRWPNGEQWRRTGSAPLPPGPPHCLC